MVLSLDIESFHKNDLPVFIDVAMVSLEGAGSGAGGSVRESAVPRFGNAKKAAGGAARRSRAPEPASADPAQSPAREHFVAADLETPGSPPAQGISLLSTKDAPVAKEPGACGDGPGAGGTGQGKGGPGAGGDGGVRGPVGAGSASGGSSGYGYGGDVSFGSARGPAFLEKAIPGYPMLARRLGREGLVVLRLTIDEQGYLTSLEVIEDPGYGFSEAAVEAARKSRYAPARVNGSPSPCRALLPVRFELKDGRR